MRLALLVAGISMSLMALFGAEDIEGRDAAGCACRVMTVSSAQTAMGDAEFWWERIGRPSRLSLSSEGRRVVRNVEKYI